MPASLTPHPQAAAPGTVLPSHNPACYGCGPEHPAGLYLRISVGEGLRVRGRFTVTHQHEGAPGLLHGGVLAAAFDEVLGALNWLLLTPAVTARLQTDFRQPVPVGSELTIAGHVDSVSGRKVWCSGEAELPDGTRVAAASALFIQVPREHFRRHSGRENPEVPGGPLELSP